MEISELGKYIAIMYSVIILAVWCSCYSLVVYACPL